MKENQTHTIEKQMVSVVIVFVHFWTFVEQSIWICVVFVLWMVYVLVGVKHYFYYRFEMSVSMNPLETEIDLKSKPQAYTA